MLAYFGVSIIHRTLTGTTRSSRASDPFACIIYTHGGPRFIVSFEGLFVESAQNMTPEKSQSSFNTKGRFDTGLKLSRMLGTRNAFVRRGLKTACSLNDSGT